MSTYLDHAATTPMAPAALEAYAAALAEVGNPSSLHTSGRRITPTICALTSATIQGLYDTRIRRHLDTSTQAPPQPPSAARRHTTQLRLPMLRRVGCAGLLRGLPAM